MTQKNSNVPMSHPEMALAVHEQKYGHSVSWVDRGNNRVLMSGGGEFKISEDGGITWQEPFQGKSKNGESVSPSALVNLSGDAIGMVSSVRAPEGKSSYHQRLVFRHSEDEGKTWSDPVTINPDVPKSHIWQDMLLRTSSGRLILPVYNSMGQGNFHREGQPFAGGFVNGYFVTTDAHFYDPHFGASYVFYSDDDGKTWDMNRDGELFLILESNGHMEPAMEPSVTEVTPGKLLMIMRTRVGRYYQSWSNNNGETWSRPQPTHLSGTEVPAQVRTFKKTGHLLCVFSQQSEEEVRKGFIRSRLSSAISRAGGRLWESFQNIESIHEETHVEPGPIHFFRPEGAYMMRETGAVENDPRYVVPLPVGYGRWSYPSVLVLEDRVLVSYTYSWHDETGRAQNSGGNRLKVLPIKWFYGGHEPEDSPVLQKLWGLAEAPEP